MSWREAERTFDSPVVGRTTLSRMFESSAERNANRPAQAYKGGVHDRSLVPDVIPGPPDGAFRKLSYAEMRDLVRALAAGFRDLGVDAGDRVGIYAATRMEWALSDFALLAAGAVVTTVYAGSSTRQVDHLLGDSEAVGVVVEGAAELDRVREADSADLAFVVTVDRVPDDAAAALDVDVHSLADVHRRGADRFDAEAYEAWLDARDPGDLASLIYTSGTTGKPKGVELTHRNFRSNVNQTYRRFGPRPDRDGPAIEAGARTVSFLPLAHVFERLAGHFLMFAAGAQVAYAESPDTLREDFGLVSPTVGTSVPRVYEQLYDAIRSQAASSPPRKRLFEWATDVGRRHREADRPRPLLRLQRAVADRLVFERVRDALGGEVGFLISGGGSLSPDLCELYHAMGLPILEGYGLTETSPVVSANPPEAPRVGTIGPPVVDCEVRVDGSAVPESVAEAADGDRGELLVRGPNVTDGYWNLPEETAAAFTDDGWFRTGDIVDVGPDGYISFVERAKQLLTLSTGKNVAPGPIQDAFASNEFVEQCLVVGDDRRFVSALVVPDVAAVRAWADAEGLDLPADDRALCRDDRVRARIEREIDRVNDGFEPHERIKQFRLVPEEFSQENGLLTPTMKKRRGNILERYGEEITSMYAE